MSYQHLRKPNDMGSKPSVEKRPKCVFFAFWWFIVTGIIAQVAGFIEYFGVCSAKTPFSQPWTMCATSCGIGLLMLYCARMISRRNVTAVFLAALTLFFSICLVGEIQPAIIFSLPPMIFLVLPHSIRWLRLNNRFSVLALIASTFVAIAIAGLNFIPSVTDVCISNVNPLLVVVPGDKAPHEMREEYEHRYWCWQYVSWVGMFEVIYNQDGKCSYVRLNPAKTRKMSYFEDLCYERFGNRILWSNAITGKGPETEECLPMMCGSVDKNIIMIFPKFAYGGSCYEMLICDSQLNSELDFLFALPDENVLISHLNDFLENRDWILSVERDTDDAQRGKRHDIYEGLRELRGYAALLSHLSVAIEPRLVDIENPRVAKTVKEFELRRKTMEELSMIIWSAAHMAVTAIEYNTKVLAMQRHERVQLRRQYLEREDAPVPDELLPIDPKDHSGQNRIFDKVAKQFKEGRESLYWALHRKTGYSLGRPYNAAADQDAAKKDKPSKSKAPPKPRYGQNLPDEYGAKKHLFYRVGYANPLEEE